MRLNIFKRRRNVILDAQAKVEVAEGKVREAFIMFHQAQDAIDESNAELLKAAEEAQKDQEIYETKAQQKAQLKQKALDNVEANKKLSEKLADFLV
jgi:hypothetical protein